MLWACGSARFVGVRERHRMHFHQRIGAFHAPYPQGPMDHFHYRDGRLYCEETPVAMLAEEYGTPLYVYSRGMFPDTLKTLQTAMEPGRLVAGNAGILVGRVLYTKQSGEKRFLIQDAAMNDLIRPAL